MKNKKGYITLNIIIMLIILIIILGKTYIKNHKNYIITKSNLDTTKAKKSSEAKILLSIFEPFYYENYLLPNLLNMIKESSFSDYKLKIKKEDLINGNLDNSLTCILTKEGFLKDNSFNILTSSKVGYSNNLSEAKIKLGNDIFWMGDAVVNFNNSEIDLNEFFNKFHEEKDNLLFEPDNTYIVLSDSNSEFHQILKDDSGDICLVSDDKKYINIDKKNLRLILDNIDGVNIFIDKYMGIEDTISLSGIMYIRGNLIVNNNFNFKGLIIIEDGNLIVDENTLFELDGILIKNDKSSLNLLKYSNCNYDLNNILKQVNYLPGYFNMKLRGIKIY